MDEKLRHRKNSPHNQPKKESDAPEGGASADGPHSEGNEAQPRSYTPKPRTEYTQPERRPAREYNDPNNRFSQTGNGASGPSRYDEVQPKNNASRLDFEQQQNRRPRRYESTPRTYTPQPRGYEPPPARRYDQGAPRYERPYRSREEGGYRPADRVNNSFKTFKKQGKQEDLPKKVKLKSQPLVKMLSALHFASRNIALQAIREELVKINGITVTNQNAPVYDHDVVMINNQPLKNPGVLYLVFHKSRKINGSAESGETSILSVLDEKKGWYFPAGCLNRAASGIVIITNDPVHKAQENSPIAGVLKEYHVKIHKKPTAKEIDLLKNEFLKLVSEGVDVQDVKLLKETARHAWISVSLLKGKLTEIRKAVKNAGFEILAFERYSIGGFTADELMEGSWKRLSADEINILMSPDGLAKEAVAEENDDKKPKWQQLYQQWFKST
ncbi:MAG: S4 domain-containing protein [Bacteroidota bacterium]